MDHRSQSRSNVFLSASLVFGAVPVPVRVRNMSRTGALLDGGSLPPVGTPIRLVRGELNAEGAWVKKVGHSGQQCVDHAIAALRRNEALSPNLEAEAPSLRQISDDLQALCERLSASPTMLVEFGEELVKLDTLAQTLGQLVRR